MNIDRVPKYDLDYEVVRYFMVGRNNSIPTPYVVNRVGGHTNIEEAKEFTHRPETDDDNH